ncbi:MAG: ATP-binding protein [Thermodesulfobacteriota bacterium]
MSTREKKEERYRSMRMKILASMLLVPLIPFALAAIVGFTFSSMYVENTTRLRFERIVTDHARFIEGFLSDRRADLTFVANLYDFSGLSKPETLGRVFTFLQEKSNAYMDLGVFDSSGLHVAYHGPYQLAGKNYRDAQWFREVMQKGYYISDIFMGFRNVPHFVVAISKSEMGKLWVLRATIDTQAFTDVVESIRIGRTGEAYIINEEGMFQTRRRSGGALMELDPDAKKLLAAPSGPHVFIIREASGEKYYYVTTWIKDHQWLLVVRQSVAEVFQTVNQARNLIAIIAILGGILIVFFAFYLTNRIVARIRAMDHEVGRLDQQLVMAGRLAEIGEMSSGFAHEINNPLQIIRAETGLMEMLLAEVAEKYGIKECQEFTDTRDSLKQVQIQVDRCGEITSAILKFARKKDAAPKPVDVGEFIPEVIRMVAKKAEVEGIALSIETASGGPFKVEVDPSQLQQVLLNLVNNALYAVKKEHGNEGTGKVTISVGREEAAVAISVADNGCGISPENLEKIFTPFFTTKPVGQGTGLGLSICYGIVDKMGGVMKVQSEVGRGSVFTILLPVAIS